jgi:hypothetical protein
MRLQLDSLRRLLIIYNCDRYGLPPPKTLPTYGEVSWKSVKERGLPLLFWCQGLVAKPLRHRSLTRQPPTPRGARLGKSALRHSTFEDFLR